MLNKKTFLLIILFLFCSCSFDSIKNKFSTGGQEGQTIRIVGLDGEYRHINRQIPTLNSDLISSQKKNSQKTEKPEKIEPIETPQGFLNNLGPSNEPLMELPKNMTPETIIYKSTPNKEPKETPKKDLDIAAKQQQKGTFIQIGSYKSKNSAEKILQKSQNISSGFIKEANSKNSTIHKILLGPTNNKTETMNLLKKARNNGFKDAFITKIK